MGVPARAGLLTGAAVTVLASLLLLAVGGSISAAGASPPSAKVGAIYFDGWACPLSNFHFKGLLSGPFSRRRPLSGWRDDTPEAMEAQLRWAHEDGIGFFLFDWYRPGIDPCLDVAHDNYVHLQDHTGVGFALLYVNHDPFGVPPDQWPTLAEEWASTDFLNPDYVRIGGKPLLVIFDTTLFRQQQGRTDGVNAALAALRDAARRRGLPGVFVVGGRYMDYLNADCFPSCEGTDGGPNGLPRENYDALTEYAYTGVLPPVDGARPYGDVVTAKEANWQRLVDSSPFPYIPTVMDGWDPRPWDERPYGHLFWFARTATEVGSFLHDAIGWVEMHPGMRVEPAPTPPVVLLEAWNELGEGGYVLPTDGSGYSYGKAIASALGIGWTPPHRYLVRVRTVGRGVVRSTPLGLSCPPRCRLRFDEGQKVTLKAVPGRGFAFVRWIGDCTGRLRTCSAILLRATTSGAVFRRR